MLAPERLGIGGMSLVESPTGVCGETPWDLLLWLSVSPARPLWDPDPKLLPPKLLGAAGGWPGGMPSVAYLDCGNASKGVPTLATPRSGGLVRPLVATKRYTKEDGSEERISIQKTSTMQVISHPAESACCADILSKTLRWTPCAPYDDANAANMERAIPYWKRVSLSQETTRPRMTPSCSTMPNQRVPTVLLPTKWKDEWVGKGGYQDLTLSSYNGLRDQRSYPSNLMKTCVSAHTGISLRRMAPTTERKSVVRKM